MNQSQKTREIIHFRLRDENYPITIWTKPTDRLNQSRKTTEILQANHNKATNIQSQQTTWQKLTNHFPRISLMTFLLAVISRYLCIRFLALICRLSISSVWLIGNQPRSSSRMCEPSAQPVLKRGDSLPYYRWLNNKKSSSELNWKKALDQILKKLISYLLEILHQREHSSQSSQFLIDLGLWR